MKKIIFTLVFVSAIGFANAQFTITTVKGKAGTNTEDLSYPLIRSKKARVAAKIDSLLQSDILANEAVITDPRKIFKNAVYIPMSDSFPQTGLTAMDYEILVNNARVLSIKFDLESMGAYPENYWRFYCFDAETGEVLTEKKLFTPEGLQYLESHIQSERAKRIKEFMSDELPNDEDSAFARERYAECNSVVELNRFVIRQQDILFHKEMCFAHAWRPWDTDLDVAITFADIKKYLTAKGRKLLGI